MLLTLKHAKADTHMDKGTEQGSTVISYYWQAISASGISGEQKQIIPG